MDHSLLIYIGTHEIFLFTIHWHPLSKIPNAPSAFNINLKEQMEVAFIQPFFTHGAGFKIGRNCSKLDGKANQC